jgi:predicted Zn-dependent protease
MRLSQVQPDEEELRLIFTAGFVLRDIGRLDEAETIFRGMAELVSNSELPLVALGSIQLRRGEFTSAQEYCEQGLRRHPLSLYARVHRAEALLFQQRREEAEAELREIIASDPDSPHSRTARALLDAASLICEAKLTAENAV